MGISSMVPGEPGLHFLLADYDGTPENLYDYHWDVTYETPHGWHGIELVAQSLSSTARRLLVRGCDPVYISVGLKRGYWLLENYKPIPEEFLDRLSLMEFERYG